MLTTIRPMLKVCLIIIICPSLTLSLATMSIPAGVLIDNTCNKGSSSNPAYLINGTNINERVELESNIVKA